MTRQPCRWSAVIGRSSMVSGGKIMATGRLKAGIGELEITGATGGELIGDLGPRQATGARTPLMARALVLSDGAETLALVTLDLFGLQDRAAAQLVEGIGSAVGLPAAAI